MFKIGDETSHYSNMTEPHELYNCTAVLHEEFHSNSTDTYFQYDDMSNINCTDFHTWRYDNSCNVTNELCICFRELYVHFCLSQFGNSSMDETIQWELPEYYSLLYRVIGTLIQGIILFVGVVGNIMVVIVVSRNEAMASPTNCYLVSLAVADCIVLLAAVPQEILGYYLALGQWVHGEFGCRLLIFLQQLGINSSSLSLTAFTLERYIAICHPMKAQSMCTIDRAKRITRWVWIFAICYCTPWLFLTVVTPIPFDPALGIEASECHYKLSRDQYFSYYLADLVMFYVLPLLLSVISYSLIARILYKSTVETKRYHTRIETHRSDHNRTNAARIQVSI